MSRSDHRGPRAVYVSLCSPPLHFGKRARGRHTLSAARCRVSVTRNRGRAIEVRLGRQSGPPGQAARCFSAVPSSPISGRRSSRGTPHASQRRTLPRCPALKTCAAFLAARSQSCSRLSALASRPASSRWCSLTVARLSVPVPCQRTLCPASRQC